ncbi:hypothetical protein VPH35_098916 [Triticum aestivum]
MELPVHVHVDARPARGGAAEAPRGAHQVQGDAPPVFRGVRRRGGAGRWVCEVRVPGRRGCRLWLGTYVTAESAARAHDAAMLALGGRSAACLNFADSAWLLAVPSALADLADVRLAALAAVAGFQRREAAGCAATVPVDEVFDTSSSSTSGSADNTGSWATPQPCAAADEVLDVPAAALASDMFDFELDVSWVMDPGSRATSYPGCADKVFDLPAAALGDGDMFEFDLELDMFGEMDLSSHYADFAEGLLLEPPPPADAIEACWQNGDYYNDGGGDATLWSQY